MIHRNVFILTNRNNVGGILHVSTPGATVAILPTSPSGLLDAHGRTARDLRVSLTDRCNLRCTYCMPADGLAWLPKETTLTDAEVIRLIRVAVDRLGIRKIRLTGGEPLLRPGLVRIITAVRELVTDQGLAPDVALTTNGIGLETRIAELAEAGLQRVNISLDSLDPVRYAQMARRDRLAEVLRGLTALSQAGLHPVKINTVVMRGINELDIVPLVRFCTERGFELRFIEQMPLGPRHGWDRAAMIPAQEILRRIQEHFRLAPLPGRGAAPAQQWQVLGDNSEVLGRIGVIASVTRPFCGACDRTRLTADGQVRSCLFSHTESDLRGAIRSGVHDEGIAALWRGAHLSKESGHGIGGSEFRPPKRTMSSIGG